MFDSKEEAVMRLDGTVIQGPTGPVFVRTMESGSRMNYREFLKKGGVSTTTKNAELRDGFSVKPFPLGYLNRQGSCYYVQRMPVRKYKQGLHDGAIRVVINGSGRNSVRNRANFLYEGTGFYKMYFNDYPSIPEVRHLLEVEGYDDQAFGREWALGLGSNESFVLYYKARHVGKYNRSSGEFILNENRQYLKEALMEVIV